MQCVVLRDRVFERESRIRNADALAARQSQTIDELEAELRESTLLRDEAVEAALQRSNAVIAQLFPDACN